MNKIQYSVWKTETNTASSKAKNDAHDIAFEIGFEDSYHSSQKQSIRIIKQIFSMKKFKTADVIFFQYPAVKNNMQKILFKYMNKNGISIALIHDLLSIQGTNINCKEDEIAQLKYFSHLIVHNKYMEAYIRELGYTGKIVVLDLFDYLHDVDRPLNEPSVFSNTISFAGNLRKSRFLLELDTISSCRFDLYGVTGDMNFSNIKNLSYKGILPSDEIVYLLTGDFGLIWDGDTIDRCSGITGEYLKYNNPHKLSLCIAAGKPVITWKKAAIADFVIKENIGVVVDSLEQLNNMDLQKGYSIMKSNVLKIKSKVAEGYYLKKAINIILEEIYL